MDKNIDYIKSFTNNIVDLDYMIYGVPEKLQGIKETFILLKKLNEYYEIADYNSILNKKTSGKFEIFVKDKIEILTKKLIEDIRKTDPLILRNLQFLIEGIIDNCINELNQG